VTWLAVPPCLPGTAHCCCGSLATVGAVMHDCTCWLTCWVTQELEYAATFYCAPTCREAWAGRQLAWRQYCIPYVHLGLRPQLLLLPPGS
jgi:hypothetical protein